MGMTKEFNDAKEYIENLGFEIYEIDKTIGIFENVIRLLGGLISAYDLSNEDIFLQHAIYLGNKMLPDFDTPTGLPVSWFNLKTGEKQLSKEYGAVYGFSYLADVGTNLMEFTRLSQISKDPKYEKAARKGFQSLKKAGKNMQIPYLYPMEISVDNGGGRNFQYTIGACTDSFYEYLLKMFLLTKDEDSRELFDLSLEQIKIHVLMKNKAGSYYVKDPGMDYNMHHLRNSKNVEFDAEVAQGITESCYLMYSKQKLGLSPEVASFNTGSNDENIVRPVDRAYKQRPEAIESFFYMWKLTKDEVWRDMAYELALNIEKHTKTAFGYSGIDDITMNPIQYDDIQDSYFLAETIKYLYLIFDDSNILDNWVLNTEAHPFRKS
ncbi:hypothetical protein HK099_001705 [Clydaea vesicula]|uniref:alpha-1,2-Mannosidase n=1 Tax=Clydaea vesicula TaxID=447962 RepID=A0AAD5XWV6_9FUNG|nr:hypothetical protein HK099_001705 [Clydaea vesicula]